MKNVRNTGTFDKLDFAIIFVGNNKQFIVASFIVVWLATNILSCFLSIFLPLLTTKRPYNMQQASPNALKNLSTLSYYLSEYYSGNFGNVNSKIRPAISNEIIINIKPNILYTIITGDIITNNT